MLARQQRLYRFLSPVSRQIILLILVIRHRDSTPWEKCVLSIEFLQSVVSIIMFRYRPPEGASAMLDNESLSDPDKVALKAQIIIAAMILGCISFGVIVLVVMAPEAGKSFIITYIAIGMAVIALGSRSIIPSMIVSVTRKRIANNIQKKSDQT